MFNLIHGTISFNLSREDSQILKGIAIFLIIMHNNCHFLEGACLENEYTYDIGRSISWLENTINIGPHVLLNIFSFWGHYGVSIFLFLSGYGLVKKYESHKEYTLMPLPFLKDHAVKLWKLLAGGVILEIIFHGTFTSIWNPLIFTFLPNLIPHANVIQGPWWFFSLIMQFYLIYAFIIYNKSNSRLVLLTIASMLLLIVAAHISDDYLHYLKFNSFGWVLPFAAGVFCSRQKIKLPRAVLLLSLPILILCEFYFYMWLFAPIFVILIFFPLAKIRNKAYRNFWKFIGAVSPAIFVFHPFIRTGCRYINNANFTGSIYIGIMCYLIICVVFAYFYSKILSFVNNRL